MTPEQAVLLCRYVKAACPAQQVDEFTPNVWHDLIGHLRFEDAKDAVRDIAGRKPFVDPADIKAEVRRIRAKRIHEAGDPTPPAELNGDPVKTIAWLKDARRRIGDGEPPERFQARGELKPRNMPELLAKATPRPQETTTTPAAVASVATPEGEK